MAVSRAVSIVESTSLERDWASSAPIAAITSCGARGSSTWGSAGCGFSAGPLSTTAWTTIPARIPTAKSESVATARASFTALHLAAVDGQRQWKELIDALRIPKADRVDVHGIHANGRAADVRERKRLDLRRRSAGIGGLKLGGAL